MMSDAELSSKGFNANQDTFRMLFDSFQDGVFVVQDGIVQLVNTAAAQLVGYAAEELVGYPLTKIIAPEDQAMVLDRYQRRLAGETQLDEYIIHTLAADGETRIPMNLRVVIIDYCGRPAALGTLHNLTEQMKMEEDLREREEQYRTLFNSQQDGVFLIQGGRMVLVNEAFARMVEYTPDEIIGVPFPQLIAPEDLPVVMENYRRRQAGEPVDEEYVFHLLHKDGAARTAVNMRAGVATFKGQVASMGTVRDVTEHMRDEMALHESEQRLRNVLERSPIGMHFYRLEPDDRLVLIDANPSADQSLKADPKAFIGKTLEKIFPGIENTGIPAACRSLAKAGGVYRADFAISQPDHAETVYSFTAFQLAPGEVMVTFTDITERLRETSSFARLASILEATSDIVGTAGFDGKLLYMNTAGRKVLGLAPDADVTQFVMPSLSPDWANEIIMGEAIPTAMQQGVWHGETALLRPDKTEIPILQTLMVHKSPQGEPQFVSMISRDITERKQFEKQLQEIITRRGYQVQLSTEIAQEIAAAPAVDDLLARVVSLVKDRLGYYHTQVLMYEPALNAVVLVKGYGETGERMKAGGHQMLVGQGLIGRAVSTGQTTLRPDVTLDPDWRSNPLLPETKGEIAVPIKFRDHVLGVLDVQSNKANALTEDDRQLLEGLCGQIAISLESARLREEMQERLNELNRMYQETSRKGWGSFRETADLPSGYMYDRLDLHPVSDVWVDEMVKAIEEKQLTRAADDTSASVAPLSVRGEVIGALGVYNDPHNPLTDEELSLVDQVSDQIALALENARLFDQTRIALDEAETLYNFSRQLSEAEDLNAVVSTVAEATGISEISRGLLITFNYNVSGELSGGLVKAAWSSGHGAPVNYPVGTRFSGDSAVTLLPRLQMAEPLFLGQVISEEAKGEGVSAMITLPVWSGAEQIGTIVLEMDEPYEFTDAEKRLISSLAQQAAIAVQSRLLFEETISSEENLSRAQQMARMGSWTLDLKTQVLLLSREHMILMGLEPDSNGMLISVTELAEKWVVPDDINIIAAHLQYALENLETVDYSDQFEYRLKNAGGQILNLQVSTRKQEGQPTVILGTTQDITESKQAEAELQNQQRTLQAVLDNMPAGVFMVEAPSGKPILSNKKAEEFLGRGISPNAVEGNINEVYQAYKFGTEELYPAQEMPVVAGLYGQAKSIDDMEVMRPDGSRVLLEVTGTPVYAGSEQLVASLVMFQDITERHKAELLLTSQQRTLQAVLDNMPAGVFMVEAPSGKPILSNKKAEEFLGRGISPNAVGEDLNQVYQAFKFGTDELYPAEEMPIVAGMFGQSKTIDDMEVVRPDGSRVLLQVNGSSVFDAEGKVVAAVVLFQDITQTKAMQDTIAKRAVELATVAEISTRVAALQSPDEMLQTVVDLTRQAFGLYHAHVYLLNDVGDKLLLAKGAGVVGRKLVEQGHEISYDAEKSLVARAARTRQGVSVNNVRLDPDFLPNKLLPDTLSEMAVPMIAGDRLLGILDVQDRNTDRFTPEDVNVMTTLATQIAVSLQNARSYARAQRQAEREALINAISERIQATNSVENALQVAVREIGRALGAQHTAIRLGLERKTGNNNE